MCVRPRYLKNSDIYVKCGKCVECQQQHSTEWAWRIMLEASQYEKNCMVTLTYNDENLPENGSLSIEHQQAFMKALRQNFKGVKIRFFACGEYGDLATHRPHYHIALFNCDFDDKWLFFIDKKVKTYRSNTLEKIWKKGFSSIVDLTFDTAKYLSNYLTKPFFEPYEKYETSEAYYPFIADKHGEIKAISDRPYFDIKRRRHFDNGKLLPFVNMSRRPGIGSNINANWYESNRMYINGRSIKLPRYYWKKLAREQGDDFAQAYRWAVSSKIKLEYLDHERIAKKKKELKRVFGNAIDENCCIKYHLPKKTFKKLKKN